MPVSAAESASDGVDVGFGIVKMEGQPLELLAGSIDQLVIPRRFGAACPPRLDGLVEGFDSSAGRQPDARGIDVDPGGLEFLLRSLQRQQSDVLLLLAQQRLDLVAVPAEAQEDTLVDHHRGDGEPSREAKNLGAGLGVASHVAHVHGGTARLEKGQRGLAIGIALHGEQKHLLHGASNIPPLVRVWVDGS
jgi:hypothetical protein